MFVGKGPAWFWNTDARPAATPGGFEVGGAGADARPHFTTPFDSPRIGAPTPNTVDRPPFTTPFTQELVGAPPPPSELVSPSVRGGGVGARGSITDRGLPTHSVHSALSSARLALLLVLPDSLLTPPDSLLTLPDSLYPTHSTEVTLPDLLYPTHSSRTPPDSLLTPPDSLLTLRNSLCPTHSTRLTPHPA